jgi:hypothetical protein
MRESYILLREVMVITPAVDKAVRDKAKSAGTIFNYNETTGTDKLRAQAHFERYESKVLLDFTQNVEDVLVHNRIYDKSLGVHSLHEWAVLVAKAGCQQQHTHTDYNVERMSKVSDERKPFGAIVAFDDNTKLVIGKDMVVTFDRGDILVFRGDTPHAGASYDAHNVRVHVYGDSSAVYRDENKTYLTTPL